LAQELPKLATSVEWLNSECNFGPDMEGKFFKKPKIEYQKTTTVAYQHLH
jgi:hypothetical protein